MLDKKGNILLYVVIVVGAILSLTLAVSSFVFSGIRISKYMADYQGAYYAAESGAERALYNLRKQDILLGNGDCGFDTVNCQLTMSDKQVTDLTLNLAENQSIQFDLFKPESGQLSPKIYSITFGWQGAGTTIEVSKVLWPSLPAGQAWAWETFPSTNVSKLFFPFASSPVTDSSFDANKNYRIRLKALSGAANNLVISFYDGGHNKISVPNFLNIKAVGSYGNSSQTINIDTQRYSPILGLFDYVLFSEEILKK